MARTVDLYRPILLSLNGCRTQFVDPHYYRVISTPKHYAVHSGPEPTRHFTDVDVSKHDEEDTYLPAFRAAVVEGHAGSVMCAYNAINGEPACASQFLLEQTLLKNDFVLDNACRSRT